MGYSTDFIGEFEVTPPLNTQEIAWLQALNRSRRMKRAPIQVPLERRYRLPHHTDEFLKENERFGEHWVDSADDGEYGQARTLDILDYNTPPPTQPGLWCQWTCSDDGERIMWDEGEKFYDYIEWIEYIMREVIIPGGHIMRGEVEWDGEDRGDIGKIVATDHTIKTYYGRIEY